MFNSVITIHNQVTNGILNTFFHGLINHKTPVCVCVCGVPHLTVVSFVLFKVFHKIIIKQLLEANHSCETGSISSQAKFKRDSRKRMSYRFQGFLVYTSYLLHYKL